MLSIPSDNHGREVDTVDPVRFQPKMKSSKPDYTNYSKQSISPFLSKLITLQKLLPEFHLNSLKRLFYLPLRQMLGYLTEIFMKYKFNIRNQDVNVKKITSSKSYFIIFVNQFGARDPSCVFMLCPIFAA